MTKNLGTVTEVDSNLRKGTVRKYGDGFVKISAK